MDTANIFEIKKMVNDGALTQVRAILHTGFPGGHELIFSGPINKSLILTHNQTDNTAIYLKE